MLVLWGAMGALLGLWTGDLRIGRGGLSPRGIPTKTHNSCGTDSRRPSRTLGPLGPSDRHPDYCARKLLPRATFRVALRGSNASSRNRYRSAEVPGASGKRLAQNHH